MDEKNCAVDALDPNNYVKEKNYNAPENEQIHVTDGAINTNHILHNVESDVDSEVEFENYTRRSGDQVTCFPERCRQIFSGFLVG